METTRAGIAIYKINYQSDFILTVVCDVEWGTPFCIKFWTGEPAQAYYVGWDGKEYRNCKVVESDPSKLLVLFDDHHLPVGELKMQIVYHTTIEDFPNAIVDEVTNSMKVMAYIDGKNQKVALDFEGEEAAELQFELPAYANEAQRIANEEQRIANEQARIEAEQQRIDNEQTRQNNEAQRIAQETARVNEYAGLKADVVAATTAANDAATLATQQAQLAVDKAALADAAATLANQKAQLAADKAALADAAATLANQKAALAQQKAEYADAQGDYAKEQGDYAKEQGDTALADHRRAESDHETAASDHTQAGNDHTRAESDHSTAADDHTLAASDHSTAAEDHTLAASDHSTAADDHTLAASDHSTAANDHTQAGNDHTRAESDHTRAESDHAAVEVYVDSLGAFDISSYHATGGVLAKYADLTAALGTNGANIPEAIRKGGMSVKFVQSSDKNYKYVQYMYKVTDAATAATFTNVANWEKMNLEEEVSQLRQEVDELNADIFGGYLAASPVVTLNKCYVQAGTLKITDLNTVPGTWNFALCGYQVSKGQLAKINIPKAGGSGKVLSFSYILPAANVVVASFVDGIAKNQPLVDYVYTAPDDGYIVVLYDTTQAPPTVELMMPDRFGGLEELVEDVEEELAPKLPVELSKSEVAYVNKDTRRYVVTSSNYGCRFYAIEKGKKYGYYIKDTEGTLAIPVSFFEELPVNTSRVHSSLSVEGGAGVTVEGEFVATIDGYVCLCGDKALAFSLELIKGTIDQRFEELNQKVETIGENAVSRQELYSEGEVVYELPEELVGPSLYTGHTNLGLVHKATQREVFNQIMCCICRAQTPNTGTLSVYKSNITPNKNTAELLFSIENFSSDNFAPANGIFTINLGRDVVLEIGEYLFTCFSGTCALYLYETATRDDESEREGFIYAGSYNTYRYSSSMTLAKKKGDIVALWEAIEGEETETVRITIPDDLYCIKGKPQWFYYNNFIFGKESVYGNNIENLHIEARATTPSIGTEKEDGFCVDGSTAGNYPVTINVYDLEMNPITSKVVTVHISEPKNIGGSNILMLGDSWTDPSIPIAAQSPQKGYTAETDAALKELGLTLNFVGSIDCGWDGLKNEGRGGYAWDTYSKAPTQVRFKFFVETMPNVSIGDVYTNNGSSYTVFEKGDGYITMTRTSGTNIPSGNTLTKSSGSGDATITFTSFSQTTGNPFWNPTAGKVDFTYWRNLIGLEETLDFVTIQLGVNDCLGAMKTTKGQWKDNLDGASTIIDAILDDSPSCKVIVNLVGLDAPSNTGWSSLNGLSSSKSTYQSNVYYLRKYINEMLTERDDFGTSVFIGQSVLGMNRWFGYEYSDKRDVYFQINTQTLDPTILNNLRNKTYTFFWAGSVFMRLYGYDDRGYAILRPFLGTSWESRDQEFTGSKSDFDFSTIPSSGNLVLHADSSIVIPYTTFKIENDNLKTHYFSNATHPYARGYREMARTLVAQIISI